MHLDNILIVFFLAVFCLLAATSNLYLKQVPVTFPRMYLAAGATTIRTCGSMMAGLL
ncbi:MAG: hypothetical protein ABIN94_08220 [Ferruginibacter sp.]